MNLPRPSILLGFVAISFATHVIWEQQPSIVTCSLYWCCAMAFDTMLIIRAQVLALKVAFGIATLGGVSNMIVTLANAGYMPFLGVPEENHGFWVAATSSHKLMALADIYWGSCSIGDFILGFGLTSAAVIFIVHLLRQRKAISSPTEYQQEGTPQVSEIASGAGTSLEPSIAMDQAFKDIMTQAIAVVIVAAAIHSRGTQN